MQRFDIAMTSNSRRRETLGPVSDG